MLNKADYHNKNSPNAPWCQKRSSTAACGSLKNFKEQITFFKEMCVLTSHMNTVKHI